jgi:hypothetical protein
MIGPHGSVGCLFVQDVTGPLARVAFSCLVLENNPTGDVTTTMVAGARTR